MGYFKHTSRDLKAKSLRRGDVDVQIINPRLLDRKFVNNCALEYSINIFGGAVLYRRYIRGIGH